VKRLAHHPYRVAAAVIALAVAIVVGNFYVPYLFSPPLLTATIGGNACYLSTTTGLLAADPQYGTVLRSDDESTGVPVNGPRSIGLARSHPRSRSSTHPAGSRRPPATGTRSMARR
jgi:hypothetical protein